METENTAGWLTEKQLIANTGGGSFTLDRWRREGLIPWDRRFLGFGEGTVTVYPPIAFRWSGVSWNCDWSSRD
jgi:hypothetical protein